MKTKKKNQKAVVITTEHRGVFFGYLEDDKKAPAEITLSKARICVHWSSDVKGVLGLAATGPTKSCRISHAVPEFKAYKVTAVLECTPEAAEAWEKALWS